MRVSAAAGGAGDNRNGEGIAAAAREAAAALERIGEELAGVLRDAECEMRTLAGGFEELASATNHVLETTAAVVGCAQGSEVLSLPARVQQLDRSARSFLQERLRATAGILETVQGETVLLGQLARQTQAQRGIAKETEVLRVLTNIEVARLGDVGASFEYLAHELSDFSQAVVTSTAELTGHTEQRRRTVDETRRALTGELPRMREAAARTEEGLERAEAAVAGVVHQLAETPGRLHRCVQEIAEQIAGVVAAIQGHDITRQQVEHVESAVTAIAAELRAMGDGEEPAGAGEKRAEQRTGLRVGPRVGLRIGLRIQSYQLRKIQETVEGWTAQIRTCLEAIGRIASSEVLELAPAVLDEERRLSSQLAGMERLEETCAAEDARVRDSFAGIAGLMQLVNEHLERSKAVRERLQLLMFNSIVEASHLGTQADGILEISTSIKRIAAAWSGTTRESEEAIGAMAGLVDASGTALAVFEQGKRSEMNEAGSAMHAGLEILRSAAGCAEGRGREIQEQIGTVRRRLVGIGSSRDRLDACFGRLAAALETLEQVRNGMPLAEETGCDMEAVERRFSADYTTEMEREVLRAALRGGPLPKTEASFAGNTVELF